MKRKFIAALLAVSMIATTSLYKNTYSVYAANNNSSVSATVEKAGDEIYGFKVLDIKYNEKTKTDEIMLEHEKTGAKMLVMKNDNKDRGFCIGFNTPSESDKGINHILEHSLLGGSEKYPSNNIVFNIQNSTYTSYINGLTGQNYTIFPVCSQSEEQLMKLTDVYMDAVYHPLVTKDKKIFEREAWRYEMEDSSSPLTVNGIVYNEMKGNYGDIDNVASENVKKSLLRDTNQRYDSGGVPDSILDLSYDELLNTYKKNYNPSNSFMSLYGDVDYGRFLKMINDNYLSKYDKKEVNIDRQIQKDSDGLYEADYDFPAAKDSEDTGSIIDAAFAMNDVRDMPKEDFVGLSLLASLLNDDSSDFMKALNNSGIGEDYTCSYIGNEAYEPIFDVTVKNADPSKKKEFYDLVMSELNKAASNGINKELASSVIKSTKFSDALRSESGSAASLRTAANIYMIHGDPTVDSTEYLKSIQGKIDSGYLEDLIKNYLINNKKTALVTTNPKPGLLEEQTKNLQDKLASKKASMSEDEINTIVKNTKEFKEWNSKDADQNIINSVKAIKTNDIPIEVKDYNLKEDETEGVKIVNSTANVDEIGYVNFDFDISHLNKDELHYLEFYCALINESMPTASRDINTVKNLIASNTRYFMVNIGTNYDDKDGNSVHPTIELSSYIMNSDIKDNLSLFNDILLNSLLDENSDEYIKNALNDEKEFLDDMQSDPSYFLETRARAYTKLASRYEDFYSGLDYKDFITKLEKEYSENPNSVIEKLKSVREKAFGKKNLTVLYAGNVDGQSSLKNSISSFTQNLNENSYEKASVDLPIPDKREAYIINSQAQYLYMSSSLNDTDTKNDGNLEVMAKLLKEKYLLPQIRLNGGAYTVGCNANEGVLDVHTARDNDYYKSMNVIKGSGNYLKDTIPEITPDILDNYIISTFAKVNSPKSEFSGAINSLFNYEDKFTSADQKKLLEQIKSTDLDSLKNSPELLDKLNSNANYVVAASPDEIEAHKDLFDKIIKLK